MLELFDNTISYIVTVHSAGDVGREQMGLNVHAAKSVQEFVYTLGTAQGLNKRENGEGQIY